MSFSQGASSNEFMSVTRPGKNSCLENKTSFYLVTFLLWIPSNMF